MDQTPCIFTTFHTDVSLTLYFLLRGRRLYVTSNNYLIHAETIVTQTSQYLEGTGEVTCSLAVRIKAQGDLELLAVYRVGQLAYSSYYLAGQCYQS